ncbi:hypothetical protein, partial [Neisseria musculi]|uniref:hypothetical protein n=1 Tax=Neisseria musculi TaxID=1815583 RepID=UPI0036168F72
QRRKIQLFSRIIELRGSPYPFPIWLFRLETALQDSGVTLPASFERAMDGIDSTVLPPRPDTTLRRPVSACGIGSGS